MPAIQLKGISKTYKDGSKTKQALKPTDLSVMPGEFVAIIGPSGSGKSTLLTIMGGLQTPTEGTVEIGDQPFSDISEKERAKLRFDKIGFILQASNLVPFLTVHQQLQLVDKVTKQKAKGNTDQLLEDLGIDSLKKQYPEDLSGGERQRVAIARALYNDPDLILADEPTASLDTERAMEVVEILAKEAKERNTAIIMVTHDLRLIDHCDHVYEMVDGTLSEYEK